MSTCSRAVPLRIRKSLYSSLIKSHLRFGAIIYGAANPNYLEAISILQRKAIWLMLFFSHQLRNLFHVDLLTKLPLASEIQQTEEKLRDHSWLNSDPSGWDHITRGALPALPDRDLIQDLELNRDYIEEAEQIISQFQKASKELFKLNSYFEPEVAKCGDSTL